MGLGFDYHAMTDKFDVRRINANFLKIDNAMNTRLPAVCTDNPAYFNIDEPTQNGLWNCWPEVTTGTLPPVNHFNLQVIMMNADGYKAEFAYTAEGPVYYRFRNGAAWTTWEQITGKACSTTEHWTGEYWIDGRKIYEKTVVATIGSGWSSIAHGVSNIGALRTYVPYLSFLGYCQILLPYDDLASAAYSDFRQYSTAVASVDNTYIRLYQGAGVGYTSATFTIRYTCTDR